MKNNTRLKPCAFNTSISAFSYNFVTERWKQFIRVEKITINKINNIDPLKANTGYLKC